MSKATLCGVAVIGLNETQLQQPRSQMASCLAKRMHGKSATMVLMMAGDELDPVFDPLASVNALAHALWDGWMPQATMAKSRSLDRRERSVRCGCCDPQTHVQWTILEHDPFLWCMHDGRIVDP